MPEFNFPEWRLGPEAPPAADLPPPEYAEADAVHEQQLNDQYLAGQRQILNQGEGAYYRQQGEAAIHAAPPALEALQQLKDDTLAQAGNDRQREALTQRLNWHHGEAARGISRHLAGQADVWRQTVADNQVKTAEEEAAVNHTDPTKVELFATGAYTTRLRSAGQPPDSEAAQAMAAEARSSVYRRAIEAALAAGDTSSAIGLYERAKDRLTAGDAGPMQSQIKAVTQREIARTYLAGLPKPAPGEPSAFFDAPKQLADADAAYRAATVQNQTDWAHDDAQRAINQHYIDVQFGQQKQAIADAKARLDTAVSSWIAAPRPDGRPQTDLPPPALWVQLSLDEQQTVLAALKRNATGKPASGQARSFGIAAQVSTKAARDSAANAGPARPPAYTELAPGYTRAVVDSTKDSLAEDLLTLVQDVRDNKQQGDAARDALVKSIRAADKKAKIVEEARIYAPNLPDLYMVADIIFRGNGVSHLVIVEVKSGEARLSQRQVTLLAEALKTGDVYITNEDKARELKVRPNETFKSQGIQPLVAVAGGAHGTIVRQLMNEGVDIGGRRSRFRLGVPPN
jgi:hypothetical protein